MIPEKFRSRKFILSLTSAVVGLIVVFFPDQEEVVNELAQQIAGLVIMAGSLLGWVVVEGGIDKEREITRRVEKEGELQSREHEIDREERSQQNGNNAKNGGFARTQTAVGLVVLILACAAGTAVLAAMSGCATPNGQPVKLSEMEPEQAYYVQLQTFNDTVATAIKAKQAGLYTQEFYDDAVYPLIQQADSYLVDAKAARDRGDLPSFRDASKSLESVLDKLILKTRPLENQLNELGRLEDTLDEQHNSSRVSDWYPRPEDVGPRQRKVRRAA